MNTADLLIENIFIVLSPKVLWIVFALGLGILIMVSFALMYHWREYALAHHVKNVAAQKWYVLVTILMILVSLGLLITYTTMS